ncbi:MAG TPA: DUF4396 domain-containing protein, partial [Candidatus Saccharimonadaceae bacterium]|nr:DUF4396 domain-containing protein [Candidatus Saccharimonadaceae bacterium]
MNNDHATHHTMPMKSMALMATAHCLLGCAIGEMIGVTIGTIFEFPPHFTVALAAILSFVSGYSVSTMPLVHTGVAFRKAL